MSHDQDDPEICDWFEDVDEEVEDRDTSEDDEPLWTPPQFGLASILGLIAFIAIICSLSATVGTDAESRLEGIVQLIVFGASSFLLGLMISGLVRLVQCGERADLQPACDRQKSRMTNSVQEEDDTFPDNQ